MNLLINIFFHVIVRDKILAIYKRRTVKNNDALNICEINFEDNKRELTILNIPTEILSKILSYLSYESDTISLFKTCKYFGYQSQRYLANRYTEFNHLILGSKRLEWFRAHNFTPLRVNAVKNISSAEKFTDKSLENITDNDILQLINKGHIGKGTKSIRLEGTKSINLVSWPKITDECLNAIATNCPNLTNLDLSCYNLITDFGLAAIANRCPNLTDLRLFFLCGFEITDVGLTSIAHCCANLKRVTLVNINITDASLISIAENCPNLIKLVLERCALITDVGIVAITKNCHALTSLVLRQVPKVTDEVISTVGTAYPNIEVISNSCTNRNNLINAEGTRDSISLNMIS